MTCKHKNDTVRCTDRLISQQIIELGQCKDVI